MTPHARRPWTPTIGRAQLALAAVALYGAVSGCGSDDVSAGPSTPAIEVPANAPFVLDIDPGVVGGSLFWLMEGSDQEGWRETHWLRPEEPGVEPSFGLIEGGGSIDIPGIAFDWTEAVLIVPPVDGDEALICVDPSTDVWCKRIRVITN